MALFLRGDVWWMEYRTRRVRRVLSTGFRKADKAKAQAAYDALRLGMGAKPRRSAMEKVLEAIYGNAPADPCLALSSMWSVYQDWCKGKGKVVAKPRRKPERLFRALNCKTPSVPGTVRPMARSVPSVILQPLYTQPQTDAASATTPRAVRRAGRRRGRARRRPGRATSA